MKKILILLSLLALGIVVMCYLYFSKLNTDTHTNGLLLRMATNHSALLFNFENEKTFYDILNGQDLLQKVMGREKTEQLDRLKKAWTDQPALNEFIKNQAVYLSVHPGSGKNLDWLICTQLKAEKKTSHLLAALKSKGIQTESVQHLYKLSINDSSSYFLGLQNNILLISPSADLVNKTLNYNQTESTFAEYVQENSRFSKSTFGNIFLNFNEAPALLKHVLASNLNGELSVFNQQNSFAALSYNFSKERLLFNGNTEVYSKNSYYNLFNFLRPEKITINNTLPYNTANYTIYAINGYDLWKKELNKWFIQKKDDRKNRDAMSRIKNNYRIDLEQVLPTYFKNQFATFQLQTGEKLGVISLSNGDKVAQLFLDISEAFNDDIRIFKPSGILYTFFGEPFKKFDRPYYTISDNNLIVANNASTLQVFLNNYKTDKLLIQTPSYLAALNQLSNTANISFYINLKNSSEIFRNNIYASFYKQFRKEEGLKNFEAFCYQLSSDKNKFQTNMLLTQADILLSADSTKNKVSQ